MPTKITAQNTSKTAANKRSPGKRPAAPRGKFQPSAFERVLRENLHWLFLGAGAILIGVLLFIGYQKAVASSIFTAKQIDVSGANRADNKKLAETARNLVAQTGIWNADLTKIQKEIEQQPWVKTALVSRVLPDGLRIRLTEREPKAVVQLDSNAKVWVDDEARILGETKFGENAPFVMTGWNEANDAEAVKKNQERVRLYLKILNEFRAAEISGRVVAIDLSVLQDIEAAVDQNGIVKPVKLGNRDFAERLKPALIMLETTQNNGTLETIEKITAYDRTPVIGYNFEQWDEKVKRKTASKTVR